MTTKLSDEQRQAIEQQGAPVYVDDPVKHLQYVLIPADVYERVRALFGTQSFDVTDTYAAQEQALGSAGWNDPALDAYSDYDAHRPQS